MARAFPNSICTNTCTCVCITMINKEPLIHSPSNGKSLHIHLHKLYMYTVRDRGTKELRGSLTEGLVHSVLSLASLSLSLKYITKWMNETMNKEMKDTMMCSVGETWWALHK